MDAIGCNDEVAGSLGEAAVRLLSSSHAASGLSEATVRLGAATARLGETVAGLLLDTSVSHRRSSVASSQAVGSVLSPSFRVVSVESDSPDHVRSRAASANATPAKEPEHQRSASDYAAFKLQATLEPPMPFEPSLPVSLRDLIVKQIPAVSSESRAITFVSESLSSHRPRPELDSEAATASGSASGAETLQLQVQVASDRVQAGFVTGSERDSGSLGIPTLLALANDNDGSANVLAVTSPQAPPVLTAGDFSVQASLSVLDATTACTSSTSGRVHGIESVPSAATTAAVASATPQPISRQDPRLIVEQTQAATHESSSISTAVPLQMPPRFPPSSRWWPW